MMKDYIEESIKAFGVIIDKGAVTPARNNLFQVGEEGTFKRLNEDKSDKFHHLVSKLLYVSK